MEEIRDYVIVVSLILGGTITFVLVLGLTFVSWKTLKGVRWLRRQHDECLTPLVDTAAEHIQTMNEQMSTGSGALELGMAGYRFAQAKRKRRKKSRIDKLRQAITALRPG